MCRRQQERITTHGRRDSNTRRRIKAWCGRVCPSATGCFIGARRRGREIGFFGHRRIPQV